MKLRRMRLCNYRCFGPEVTEIEFDDTTFVLGPNGSGKTAVLHALALMFSLDPAQRRVRSSDFHAATSQPTDEDPDERELWLEADFEFPELQSAELGNEDLPAVPGNFAHMLMTSEDEALRVRFRLRATVDADGDIEESFTYVVKEDADGAVLEESRVPKQDRNAVQVHYLPARRDPSEHISYSANALLGRALRAVNWTAEREEIAQLTGKITQTLTGNSSIEQIGEELSKLWGDLHKGKFYANPSVSFARSEIESLLRHLSLGFTPAPGEELVDFSRLSDGQQSLLYISLVLAMREISDKVLSGDLDTFNIDKLRPPIFTLLAVEEPENSLSPHYLGRVIRVLNEFASGRDAQAVVATHAPSLLRRVQPEAIRYLRLDQDRRTTISRVVLPPGEEAQKYVREGVQAFPELYFSRLVVLGEGDSEEVVLPRLLGTRGILADDASISFVPLGGRHVNHFWRLLGSLGIPFVTLLDLDLARFQGGWGRIKYAATQLRKHGKVDGKFDQASVNAIPAWDSNLGLLLNGDEWLEALEEQGVFFSSPLDLDFMMLEAFGDAYEVGWAERQEPDEDTIKSVLGKNHDVLGNQYTEEQQSLFDAYYTRFKLGSKPTAHVRALAELDDDELRAGMPDVLERMFDHIEAQLEQLPE